MKKLLTIALVLGAAATSFGQSTDGWNSVFSDNFSNNKYNWGQSPNGTNTTKIHFDQNILITMVTDNGKKLTSANSSFDFNNDFILKAVVSGTTKEKRNEKDPTSIGLIFGHTHHDNLGKEGWYSIFIDLHEDVVTIRSATNNGAILFERSLTSATYDNFGKNEIGVMKDGDMLNFYLNGKLIYENEPTETAGSTITFAVYNKSRGNLHSVDIYEKN